MSKKRRKPKRNKALHIMGLLQFILAVVIIVVGVGGFCYAFCGLKQITMTGTELYTEDAVVTVVTDCKYPQNAAYVFLKNKIKPVENVPFIQSMDVKMTGLDTLVIEVHEKPILGYVVGSDGSYVYYDFDGIITEISTRFVDGYMLADGLISNEPVVGNQLDVGDKTVNFLLTLTKLLEKYDLHPNSISFDESKHATLHFDAYDIVVGNASSLEDKMARLPYILPSIEGYTGILHLENFSVDNTDIVFEKTGELGE